MLDRKHLQRTTLQLAMVCLCLLMGQAFAGTVTVFGPKLYVRGKGQPVTQRDSFAVSNPAASYTLAIVNGAGGHPRVRAAA